MTTMTDLMVADLAYVLSLEEAAESATFTPKTGGSPITDRMSIQEIGDSDNTWSGGTARILIALLPKAVFPQPKTYDTITRTSGKVWYIDSLISESKTAWIVKAYTETRPR